MTNNSQFSHYPKSPTVKACDDAYYILVSAHDASSSFLDTFTKIRKARKAQGTPTDEEQDLLRAMLAFSTAGLDSMIKQLIRDTLPLVIDKDEGAQAEFKNFVKKKIKKDEQINDGLMADVICDKEPRRKLISLLVDDLVANSLQSPDAIFKAGAFFNIPTKDLCTDTAKLKEIFHARNQIIHEMDMKFGQINRSRNSRSLAKMKEYTNFIFSVAERFLAETEKKIPAT